MIPFHYFIGNHFQPKTTGIPAGLMTFCENTSWAVMGASHGKAM